MKKISKAGGNDGPIEAVRKRPVGNCVSTMLTGSMEESFRPLAFVVAGTDALMLPPNGRDQPAERRHKT